MILSEIGKIADKYWRQIPNHYPKVGLDEYIIMPNHIHGIIAINDKNNIGNKTGNNVSTIGIETPHWGVSTKQPDTPAKQQTPGGYNYKWKPNSLGSIINQYKSICTKRIRRFHDAGFRWQPRFYDHIIRDDGSLGRIRQYIINNPDNWENDQENID